MAGIVEKACFDQYYASDYWSSIKFVAELADQIVSTPLFRREYNHHLVKSFFQGNVIMLHPLMYKQVFDMGTYSWPAGADDPLSKYQFTIVLSTNSTSCYWWRTRIYEWYRVCSCLSGCNEADSQLINVYRRICDVRIATEPELFGGNHLNVTLMTTYASGDFCAELSLQLYFDREFNYCSTVLQTRGFGFYQSLAGFVLRRHIDPATYWDTYKNKHHLFKSYHRKNLTIGDVRALGMDFPHRLTEGWEFMDNPYPYKYNAFLRSPWQNKILFKHIARVLRLVAAGTRSRDEVRKYLLLQLILSQYVRGLVAYGAPRSAASLEKRLAQGNIGRCLSTLLASPLAAKPTATWLLSRCSAGVSLFLYDLNARFSLHLLEYTSPVCKRDKWHGHPHWHK